MDTNIITPSKSAGDTLAAALDYARRGLHVLVLWWLIDGRCACGKANCTSPGKHPLTLHGVKDATTDEAVIRQWLAQYPEAHIAIATGDQSGVWVLAPDGQAGLNALAKLEEQHGPLPPTPTARSGGGGRHYFFQWPVDGGIHNLANANGLPIDVRGENGYVVAAPSGHKSGGSYTWETPLGQVPIAAAPPWLLSWVRSAHGSKKSNGHVAGGSVLTVQADDLRDAPGVPQGDRNAELCRLVGHHLRRGDDAATVEGLALVWAKRCKPPLPEEEVITTVRSVADKHARSTNSPSAMDDIESLPLPAAEPWPKLNEAALYGLAGELVRRIEPQTEADPVALLIHLLVMVEATQHFTNLFACLVGDTARGRKGTSEAWSRKALSQVDEAWCKNCMVNGLSSGEGLIHAVRDAKVEQSPKDDGSFEFVVTEAGVQDKRLLVTEPEFASILKHAGGKTNILSPVLRQGWDRGDLQTLTKNCPTKATGAHLSVIGHITRTELLKNLTETEMANGFANRFLWVLVRRSKQLPEGGQSVAMSDLIDRLKRAAEFAKSVQAMHRSDQAKRIWRAAYSRLTGGRHGLFGAVTSRAEAQVLRLSLIYALLDRSAEVRPEHLNAALALWDYCQASAKNIFGESLGDPFADKVLALVRSRPGISRTELHEALHGHSQHLLQALATLREVSLIHAKQEPTGGRPKERWYPGPGGDSQERQPRQPAPEAPAASAPPFSSQTQQADVPPAASAVPTSNGAGDGMEVLEL